MAPKKQANAKQAPKKIYDYSGLEKGMRVQAESGGSYYAAEVVQVSESKNRTKAPVKVTYQGYEGYDEWVGGDRLRSKALKATVQQPEKDDKSTEIKERLPKREPYKLTTEGEIPIKRVARVYTLKVADEAAALKVEALLNEVHGVLAAESKGKAKGYLKLNRQVCKAEWAYEFQCVFASLDDFKAYDDSDWRKEALLPYVDKLKEIAVGGSIYAGVRVYDEMSKERHL